MKKKNKKRMSAFIDKIITAKNGYVRLNDSFIQQEIIDIYNDENNDKITKKTFNCGKCLLNVVNNLINKYEEKNG